MRNLLLLSIGALFIFFSACTNDQKANQEKADYSTSATFDPSVIQGTWKMTHHMPPDSSEVVPTGWDQYKIFTEDRFFFLAFNEDSLIYLGGGQYTIDWDTFTEKLEFMSWYDEKGATTTFTFDHQIEGDKLIQSGSVVWNEGEEENHLEEHYTKVEPSVHEDSDHPLLGLWKMEKMQNGDAQEVSSLPDSISRMKVITPGHFFIVSWKKINRQPGGSVFGSQKIEDGKYVETVLANTMASDMNGTSIPYTFEGGKETFRMHGEIPTEQGLYRIDEYYSRVE